MKIKSLLKQKLTRLIVFWKNLSISKKLYVVAGVMAFMVAVELVALNFAMDSLSAVRAFVGGEGLWSKSQKSAVYNLQRYAQTKNEKFYKAFLENFRVQQGDRRARLELEKENPNREIISKSFIEGRVHPDDIPAIIRLYQRFNQEPHLKRAISYWVEGDELQGHLRRLGEGLHNRIKSRKVKPLEIQYAMIKVDEIDAKLTKLEDNFSYALGEGSRFMEKWIMVLLCLAVLTVETIGISLTILLSRTLSRGLGEISNAATQIGRWNFSEELPVRSKDELGLLAASINQMRINLQTSTSQRSNVEEQLRKREAQLEEAQRIAHVGSWEWDIISDAITWSAELYHIYGLPVSTPVTFDDFMKRVLPAEREAVRAHVEQAYVNKNQFKFDHTIIRPDGSHRVLQARGRVILDAAGNVVRMIGTGYDITDLKETEEVLRRTRDELEQRVRERTGELARSHDQLEVILRGINDGITVLNDQGQIVFANEAGARMCGYPDVKTFMNSAPTEIAEKFDLEDETGNPFPVEKLPTRLALQGHEHSEAVVRFRSRENGEERWSLVQAAPIFDEHRKAMLAVSIFKDFTERKHAEELKAFIDDVSQALSSSLDLNKSMAQAIKLAVPRFADWCSVNIFDRNEISFIETSGALDLHRERLGNLFLKRFRFDHTEEEDHSLSYHTEFYRYVNDEFFSELAQSTEDIEFLKSLGIRSVAVVPLRARGKTYGYVAFLTTRIDHTYNQEDFFIAEEFGRRTGIAVDNARLYREAREAVQARDEFLSIASHELKTPFTSLHLQLQLLRKLLDQLLVENPQLQSLPKMQKIVKGIEVSEKSDRRLIGMLDELLDQARIRVGKLKLEPIFTNLATVIETVVNQFAEEAKRLGVEVTVHLEQDELVGYWDPHRIEQVMTNLFSNALKYGDHKPIHIKAGKSAGGKHAWVRVSDSGIGISKDMQVKVFERFERAVDSTKISGLGLGLYITRQIVEAHGGTIELQSEQGQGSTFSVHLPLES